MTDSTPRQTARAARDARLAEALRQNLRRRKQQARDRKSGDAGRSGTGGNG